MAPEPERAETSRPWTTGSRRGSWTDPAKLRRSTWSGLDQATIMSTELIAATATWALIGYLLDRWLGTAPWLLVIGALLGNAAGIYLIWLRSDRMEGGSRFVAPGSTHGTGNDTDGTVMDGVGPDEPRASATPAKPAS